MRLAFVTPWYSRELIGGAERHAWELSHALAAAGAEVDVLTTCCRSFNDDWATNFHRAGTTALADRLRMLRFRVDSRDRSAFGRITSALTALPHDTLRRDALPLDERDARAFVAESINSSALQAHLRERGRAYDAILFLPYLYGTTLASLCEVENKAYLIPCLHDEAYAYLDPVRTCFARARGLLFNSVGEEETAAAIYGPGIYAKSRVVGEAVEPVTPPRVPIRVRGFTPQRARYVLYLGRQVATKNIDFLIAGYRLFRERRSATALQLVLAGPTNQSRGGDGIVDLGPVNEDAKAALLTYARALAQPSLHESFSRAVYEAWHAGRPVVVHARCRATARAVEDSGGGWIGSTPDEWAAIFAEIDESSDDAVDAIGARGKAAALENGTWDVVAKRVLETIGARAAFAALRIDQAVSLGDRNAAAYASSLREALLEAGAHGEIVVSEVPRSDASAALVAHVSGDAPAVAAAAYVMHSGDAVLPRGPAPLFAASQTVARRLEERGIAARYLPRAVSAAIWDGVRNADQRWLDERPALLSLALLDTADVRRLIDVFVAFLGTSRGARLLIFASDCTGDALATLLRERSELDLEREVEVVDDTRTERYAAYRAATAAVVFGTLPTVAPVVLAHWFEVPVVALAGPSVGDDVEAGALVETAFEAGRFAALLRVVTTRETVRAAMVSEGLRIARRHAPSAVIATLLEALADVGGPSMMRENDVFRLG